MTFSLIIPVYNVAPYLHECLDSVLAQNFTDWEAICVDDGSSDDSGAILDAYKVRDSRIKVVHKKNAGVSAARNDALCVANGDYICFLDGDDVLAPQWLSHAKSILQRENADILRLDFTRFNDVTPVVDDSIARYSRFEDVYRWGWAHIANSGFICLHFVRREILEKTHVLFPVNMAIKEDVVFCLRVLGYCHVACQGEYAGYYYRTRMTSAGHAVRRVTDCLRFQRALVKELEADMTQAPDLLKNRAVAQSVACALWDDFTQWLINGKKGFVSYEKGLFKHMRMSFNKGYIDISTHTMGMIWLLPCLLFKAYGFVYALKCVAWLVRVRGATSRFLKRKVFHVNQ